MVILLFKNDESDIDPESSYSLSRRVSGFRIPLKTQALLATADIALDFLIVHFGRTPRQFNHISSLASRNSCVISEL
jgi:hypothetical protein